jgi:hypothetical protein
MAKLAAESRSNHKTQGFGLPGNAASFMNILKPS